MLTHHPSTPPTLARYPCKQVNHASANSTSFPKVIINTRLFVWNHLTRAHGSGWGEAWALNTDFRNERPTGMCHPTFLVKVFTNHILAESTHIFQESCRVRRTKDYDLLQIITKLLGNVKTLKRFPSTIPSIINFFIEQKFCKHHFSGGRK